MAKVLTIDKYKSIKLSLEEGNTKTQLEIAREQLVSRSTVNRVNQTNGYQDYLKKYTTYAKVDPIVIVKETLPEKKIGIFSRLFRRQKNGN